MKTRFVLINTSHAGNVGACARAMKNMGFDDLVLVEPRWGNVLRRQETIQRSSGALDVLEHARIVRTLDEALDGMSYLCATAMTPRDFGPVTMTPRACFTEIVNKKEDAPHGVAFLFGSERFGMKNEDVYRCHVALNIPSNPKFGSLNLAAALQVVAYEWRLALGGFDGQTQAIEACKHERQADAAQLAGMLEHWEKVLISIGFLDPNQPKKLMPRLNQILNRSELNIKEVDILRGIANAVLKQNK